MDCPCTMLYACSETWQSCGPWRVLEVDIKMVLPFPKKFSWPFVQCLGAMYDTHNKLHLNIKCRSPYRRTYTQKCKTWFMKLVMLYNEQITHHSHEQFMKKYIAKNYSILELERSKQLRHLLYVLCFVFETQMPLNIQYRFCWVIFNWSNLMEQIRCSIVLSRWYTSVQICIITCMFF